MKKQILSSALALALLMGGLIGCAEEKKPVDQDVALKGSQSEPATSGPSESTEKISENNKVSIGSSKPSESAEPTEPTVQQPKPSEGTGTSGKPGNQGGTTKPSGGNGTATKPTASKPEPTEPKPTTHTHSYSTTVVAPTCTAEGYTKHTCSCGESYNDGYAAALGHSYTDTIVEATTASGGYTTHTCSRCGDSFTDSYTPVIEVPRWDTEEAVANICARANAYAESQGAVINPICSSWVAPQYTSWEGTDAEWHYGRCKDAIDGHLGNGWPWIYVTYESDSEGGYIIYVMYD